MPTRHGSLQSQRRAERLVRGAARLGGEQMLLDGHQQGFRGGELQRHAAVRQRHASLPEVAQRRVMEDDQAGGGARPRPRVEHGTLELGVPDEHDGIVDFRRPASRIRRLDHGLERAPPHAAGRSVQRSQPKSNVGVVGCSQRERLAVVFEAKASECIVDASDAEELLRYSFITASKLAVFWVRVSRTEQDDSKCIAGTKECFDVGELASLELHERCSKGPSVCQRLSRPRGRWWPMHFRVFSVLYNLRSIKASALPGQRANCSRLGAG